MGQETGFRKAKTLTPEDFGKFLQWLSPDREKAAKEYLQLSTNLVRYFICKGCAHADELADRTMDRVAIVMKNEPDKYSSAHALSWGVAKNVYREYSRQVTFAELDAETVSAAESSQQMLQDTASKERKAGCLGSCLQGLSAHERDLIVQYHRSQGREKIETRKRLAEEHGGANKVRITAYRIRARLHECITACVQQGQVN